MNFLNNKNTATNFFWSFLSQGGIEVIRFIVAIILARLLLPSDYGLMAVVGIFTGFSTVFIQFTFSPVIIQNRDLDEEDIDTIFWLNLLVGLFVGLLFIFSGGLISQFYNEPILYGLCILAGFQIFIASFTVIQRANQEKRHNFKIIGIVKFVSMLFASLISILLAYLDYGVWALAINMFLIVFLEGIGIMFVSKWFPKFVFKRNTYFKIKKMTKSLVFERSFGHISESLDKFILGKFAGINDLGLYSRAYGFLLFPLRNISQVIAQVILPKVSENKDNLKKIKILYINSLNTVLLLIVPIMSVVFIVPDAIVSLIFGAKWLGMVPYLKVLSICGILSSVVVITQSFFVGFGSHRSINKLTILEKPFLIVSVFIGFFVDGPIGLTYGVLFSLLFSVIVRQFHISKILNINLLKQNIVFFKSCSVGALTHVFFKLFLIDRININLLMIILFLTLFIYYVVSFKFKKGFMINLKKLNSI